jgi:tetratricopeptide (TPR) repeat protein
VYPALAAAALWAVHPALTESVTNIVGRADLMAGAAILGGLQLYWRSIEVSGLGRAASVAALAIVTTVGVFSKENAVVLAGVIFLYEVLWRQRQTWRAKWPEWAAVLVPVLLMWWVRSRVLAGPGHAVLPFTDNPIAGASFWQGKLTAVAVLGRYFQLMLFPFRLSSDYSYAQVPLAQGNAADWIGWITAGVAIAPIGFWYKRNRPAAFLLLFALVNLAPAANLLFPIGTIFADRLVYLPALGVIGAIAAARPKGERAWRIASVAASVILLLCAARTYTRNSDWQDDLSLASADVETSPASYKAHYRLAAALYDADPDHGNLDRVIQEADRGLTILSGLPDRLNTPGIYKATGDYYLIKAGLATQRGPDGDRVATTASAQAYEASARLLERCLSILDTERRAGLTPALDSVADVRRSLSGAYLGLRRFPQAQNAATEALRLNPLDPRMYWALFNVLISQDRASEAAVVLIEGGVVTGDAAMRQELIRLYQLGLDPNHCALMPGSNALNMQCESVRNQLCAAAAGIERLARESPRPGIAGQMSRIPAETCAVRGG